MALEKNEGYGSPVPVTAVPKRHAHQGRQGGDMYINPFKDNAQAPTAGERAPGTLQEQHDRHTEIVTPATPAIVSYNADAWLHHAAYAPDPTPRPAFAQCNVLPSLLALGRCAAADVGG